MGGFLFNGCGAADKFHKIKTLGEYTCPHCGKFKQFHLCEVKRKVHILYIPTFSVKNSYAVMCSGCDNGKFVSAEWAHKLLTGASGGGIFENAAPQTENPGFEPEISESLFTADLPKSTCPACGSVLEPGAEFCEKCGKAVSESEENICPSCSKRAKPGAKFCGRCGARLTDNCPVCGEKTDKGQKFCGKCGAKL